MQNLRLCLDFNEVNDWAHIVASSANIVKYPKTSSSNNKESGNADSTSIDNIDEWLMELSQKSKERHTSSCKQQHKRHR